MQAKRQAARHQKSQQRAQATSHKHQASKASRKLDRSRLLLVPAATGEPPGERKYRLWLSRLLREQGKHQPPATRRK